MTKLSLAARNLLVQDQDIKNAVGTSSMWPQWVFEDRPMVLLEFSQSVMIVLNEVGSWSASEQNFNVRYPILQVDVWADPTRNSDNTVRMYDAADKIEAVFPFLNRYFNTSTSDVPPDAPAFWGTPGGFRRWGTAEEIAIGGGITVLNSEARTSSFDYSDIADIDGGVMGRLTYGLIAYY